MKKIFFLLLVLLMTGALSPCFGQKKDSTWVGHVHGITWDSEHNTVLRSATVAIYLGKDSTLIGYRLTNNYGEFDYNGLPCDVPLKLAASYIGYKSSSRNFTINALKRELDVGHLDLPLITNELKEVVVNATPPPVQMKGDTLEFNADAFKLEPNAQTEDLLRVLPGITIWADGTITVNGREIKSVLVNGKPFFGGDTRVATQNIPKNIVDKIQVYQRDKDPKKLSDSTAEINIKLKKGRGIGYFGKFSGGYGTGRHYESDGNLNFFNGRTQLGLAVSSNNVNKVANDINFVLRNNTFKGNGANVEYQSNFDTEGINKFTAGGMIFQHDFIDHPDYYNNDRLTGMYFVKRNQQDLVQNTQTINTISNGEFFTQQNASRNNNTQESQNANSTYEKISNGNKFSAEADFSSESVNGVLQNEARTLDRNAALLSVNNILNKTADRVNVFNVKAVYTHKDVNNGRSWLSNYEVGYKLKVKDELADNNYKSAFIPVASPGDNTAFDRLYHNDMSTLSNNLTFNLPNFGAIVFKDYKLAGIITGFQNNVELSNSHVHNDVRDRDTSANAYQPNGYLTNDRSELIFDIRPALTFTKKINRGLSNRYEKNFSAIFNLGEQFYNLSSNSERAFQQFSKSYRKFTPKVTINYLNRQFGEYSNNVSLKADFSTQYPTVQQLAPLVDSANLNFIQKGNADLRAQDTRELTFNFSHASERSTNIWSWGFNARAGYIKNYFSTSSQIDSLGRTTFSPVNADGYRYFNGSAEFKKAFKWSYHQIQVSASPMLALSHAPGFINDVFYTFSNLSLSYNPTINYTYKNWLEVNFVQKETYARYKQNSSNAIDLKNRISQSNLSISVNFMSSLALASNANYTKNSYNGTEARNFTIWNASVIYKFFKGNVAELRLSALDLLHQNTGLINYGFNNSITQGTVNNLKQYFMVGLAYYPRKFGKK